MLKCCRIFFRRGKSAIDPTKPWTRGDSFACHQSTVDYADSMLDEEQQLINFLPSALDDEAYDVIRMSRGNVMVDNNIATLSSTIIQKKDSILLMKPVEELFRSVERCYVPREYAYGLFDSVDIAHQLLLTGLVDEPYAKNLTRWLQSPQRILSGSRRFWDDLGPKRSELITQLLEWMLQEYDETHSPLQRYILSANIDGRYKAFLRAVASSVLYRPMLQQNLPLIFRAILDGTLKSPKMDGDVRDRARTLANLLLYTAAEYGSEPLFLISLELRGRYFVPPIYTEDVLRAQVIAKISKRKMDWALRASGQLEKCAPQWMSQYFPEVLRDRKTSRDGRDETKKKKKKGGGRSVDGEQKCSSRQQGKVSSPFPLAYFSGSIARIGTAALHLEKGIVRQLDRDQTLEDKGSRFFSVPPKMRQNEKREDEDVTAMVDGAFNDDDIMLQDSSSRRGKEKRQWRAFLHESEIKKKQNTILGNEYGSHSTIRIKDHTRGSVHCSQSKIFGKVVKRFHKLCNKSAVLGKKHIKKKQK